MTIDRAIKELLNSKDFKLDARNNSNLRVFVNRYNKGEIRNGAATELLLKYGYKIEVKGKGKSVKKNTNL